MKYTCTLDMDNEQGERCLLSVIFHADAFKRFAGFKTVVSDKPLYDEDLAHLEQFVMQAKDQWVVMPPRSVKPTSNQ
jgi:hypothetical protein